MELKNTVLGIELGSTRIKAVLLDEKHIPVASGSHDWENRLENGIWTYTMEDIHTGLQACYAGLKRDVKEKFGMTLTTVGAMGVSAMMHGYLPFDKDGDQLAKFRTWRNTITGQAAEKLTGLFGFNIPQRWSIAHLYQAILNGEEHLPRLDYLTTLAGYIHWRLTGEKVMGVGEASGMFPIGAGGRDYDQAMVEKFDKRIAPKGYGWKLRDVLPRVLSAGENAGTLTESGAKFLDPAGDLLPGIPVAPCEGDAGTGMAATNSVRVRTGNVSAGTSDFAMVVVDRPLGVHREINMVTTPSGAPVAMVHCNNCTSDINAWVNLLSEFASAVGAPVDRGELFILLFRKALEGDPDCGGLLSYNYFSGEGVTDLDGGPASVRPHAGRQIYPCQLHAHPPAVRAGQAENRAGYPHRTGESAHRQAVRTRRLLQDPRGGSADTVRRRGRACVRDGDGGGGRPLRHGFAGGLYAVEGRRRDAGGLSGKQGVCQRQSRCPDGGRERHRRIQHILGTLQSRSAR